ncbi:MAG: glutamate 5-kinase, partial [Alphaproteobacteria bacterium]|nr:glutamate 5-kinase [Alphaproteobacteria bacterium]
MTVSAANARLTAARRMVVKVGSSLLVDGSTGRLRQPWFASLCADLARLNARGQEVILVSSGAIALGRRQLGLAPGPLALEESQAAAAVGQIRLAEAYAVALASHGTTVAQILLTLDDTEERRRYLNARATLHTLLRLKALPVINENDTVATNEIRFGDNDRLAARVAGMMGADCLVLLSDIDGLYTDNPATNPAARFIEEVDEITPAIEAMAGDPVSGLSKGGMKTKIMAAKTATAGGCAMAITLGITDRPL